MENQNIENEQDKRKIPGMRQIAISVTSPQYAFLLEKEEKLGISISEYIRRIIDKERKA